MMCFVKGSIKQNRERNSTFSRNDLSRLRPSLVGIVPKPVAYTLDAIVQQGPNVVFQFTKTIIDTTLENINGFVNWAQYMSETFATSGQEYIFRQAKTQYITPILEMANVFRQTLDSSEVDIDDNFELIPRELIALIKALIKKGAEGKASAFELVVIGFITDAQNAMNSLVDISGVSTGEEEQDPCLNVCFNEKSAIPRNDVFLTTKDQRGSEHDSCNQFCAIRLDGEERIENDPNENNNNLESTATTNFDYNSIYNKMQSLLARHPYMKDIRTFSKVAGIPKRIQRIMKSALGRKMTITPEILTEYALIYGDTTSWKEMTTPLDNIIHNPRENVLTLNAIFDRQSSWNKVAIACLGSSHVQLNQYTITFATFAGMQKYVDLWQTAQRLRKSRRHLRTNDIKKSTNKAQKEKMDQYKLTQKSKELLQSLVGLMKLKENIEGNDSLKPKQFDEVSIDLIIRSLVLSKIGKEKGLNGGYNWYKLPEWLQIDMVKIFGSYMEHRPWFLYPFMDMIKSYFNVLQEEAMIVYGRYGIQKAFLSGAFVTSFVPGIVMLLLYAQLTLLAYPIQMGLASYYSSDGDYSPQTKATQIEKLIVAGSEERTVSEWKQIDERLDVALIVPGLYEVTVPSLGYMSPILEQLAFRFVDVTILRISNHDEIQVRVAAYGNSELERKEIVYKLRHGLISIKPEYMFEYRLPTLGKSPKIENSGGLPIYVVLAIKPPHLLQFIREIGQMKNASVDQIYDFWA